MKTLTPNTKIQRNAKGTSLSVDVKNIKGWISIYPQKKEISKLPKAA